MFNDFINSFSTNKCVANSKTAKHIYENIIWREDIRIKMAELSDAGIPALSACAKEIEAYCSNNRSDIDITDTTVKQTIGRMVADSLAPLGYIPGKRGRISVPKLNIFKTAAFYIQSGNATQRVEKKIVDITHN